MMSKRQKQLERLLRALRNCNSLWGAKGPKREEQARRILLRVKQRLTPFWDARASALRHAQWQKRLDNDTAIYYTGGAA